MNSEDHQNHKFNTKNYCCSSERVKGIYLIKLIEKLLRDCYKCFLPNFTVLI